MSASPPRGRSTRAVRRLPEPARFWIACAPRTWRSVAGMWTDLANAGLGDPQGPAAPLPWLEVDATGDLLYVPPVSPELAPARDRMVASLVEAGVPVLAQLLPGEDCGVDGVSAVFDLLGPLLDGELGRLGELPSGAAAVWPLIAGITDTREMWEEGCRTLGERGVRVVQPLAVELPPPLRRRLARGREDAYDALFHAAPPSERAFSEVAHRLGLEPFLPRPESGASQRRRNNRRIAAHLAVAAELWLRLGRPEAAGHALFRAARGAESSGHDLGALAREDNLTVLGWLDKTGVALVRELVVDDRCELLRELYGEYLGGAA